MSTIEELRAGVAALVGARATGFGRTLDMAEAGFARGAVETRLHAQCPFRVSRGERVLFGTVDMAYPGRADADAGEAWRTNTTMFDKHARRFTGRFAAAEHVVESAELGRAGTLTLLLTGAVVIEVVPACGGPVEQWRLFDRGAADHYVYPESV